MPSGFPLYLFPLRSKRMPLQSLTHNVNKIYHLSNMKSVVHHTLISRHSELSSPYLPICLSPLRGFMIFILNFQFSIFNSIETHQLHIVYFQMCNMSRLYQNFQFSIQFLSSHINNLDIRVHRFIEGEHAVGKILICLEVSYLVDEFVAVANDDMNFLDI